MRRLPRSFAAALVTGSLLAGCTLGTRISAVPADTTLDVKTSRERGVPRSESYKVTTFGNYEFRAEAPGKEPMYGILPLRLQGGYLALDILFFAPLAFGNMRGVYPFYEFDLDKRVIRFRNREKDEWRTYTPKPAEAERARKLFGD